MANRFKHPFKWRAKRHPITQKFGYNKARKKWHYAVDLAAKLGTVIFAIAGGVVIDKGYNPDPNSGLGHWIKIRHIFGVVSLYAHMRYASRYRIGQRVRVWLPIGLVGATGAATGPHLHFGIEVNGVAVDPLHYLANH